MSPEFAVQGQLSAKADVFSYGVLCLEVISGKTNTDINLLGTDMQHLLGWVRFKSNSRVGGVVFWGP